MSPNDDPTTTLKREELRSITEGGTSRSESRSTEDSPTFEVKRALSVDEKELRYPKWLEHNAKYWRLYDSFLMLVLAALAFVPLLLAKVMYRASDFQIFEITLTGAYLLMITPLWIVMWYWHPCIPHKIKGYAPRKVDICVTMYKEDLDVIIGTLRACQRISYDPAFLQIYALDDGHRCEVAQICDDINSSSDCVHRIIYVDRDSNKGRKGGNINNWLNVYNETLGEFFIILDTDMQPFPDIIDRFMGHFYGFSPEEQETIAFIQTPQHFCNYNPKMDHFEVALSLFTKAVLPCMDALGVVMYVGTCGLWRREAIVSTGGFYEKTATEDSITGCRVHRTRIGTSTACTSVSTEPKPENKWISKYLRRAVAIGMSPTNLPDLFDQRMRWVLGSIQMTFEHKWYFLAKEFSWTQSTAYFVTGAYWFTGLLSFFLQVGEMITVLGYMGYHGSKSNEYSDEVPLYCALLPVVACLLYIALLPMATPWEKLQSIQMYFCYTPVYLVAILKYMGMTIKIQATAADNDNDKRRWHPLFWWHIVTIVVVIAVSTAALLYCHRTTINLFIIISNVLFWVVAYFPVFLSMAGVDAEKLIGWYDQIVTL